MGPGDPAATQSDWQDDAALRGEGYIGRAGPDYVGDGIVGTDFVEMGGTPVDLPLCPVDPFEDPDGERDGFVGRMGTLYPGSHFVKGPFGRSGMGPEKEGSDPGPVDHGDLRLFHDRSHGGYHGLSICAKMEEGSSNHVPGGAMEGIEDEQAHKSTVLINPCVYDF